MNIYLIKIWNGLLIYQMDMLGLLKLVTGLVQFMELYVWILLVKLLYGIQMEILAVPQNLFVLHVLQDQQDPPDQQGLLVRQDPLDLLNLWEVGQIYQLHNGLINSIDTIQKQAG